MNDVEKINKNKKLIESLCKYLQEKFPEARSPSLKFIINKTNANESLGKTAYYEPTEESIHVYISGRHIKDILRSISHEWVHHAQNCRGDLANIATTEGYAQSDDHLREMEKEAYLKGNIIFRDFEDGIKNEKNKQQ